MPGDRKFSPGYWISYAILGATITVIAFEVGINEAMFAAGLLLLFFSCRSERARGTLLIAAILTLIGSCFLPIPAH